MLNHILNIYKSSDYDFRLTAYSEDPLSDHFSDWVDYYRMKWAITKAIKPESILEIGIRYGYSARAFLNAAPEAKFVGIDLDVPSFGGSIGALNWATQSLSADGFNITMIKGDSQKLHRLPGGTYDLIHIDGQQDGDGTFHDLNLALAQARYVLIDGYFWVRENFLAVNEWLWLNKNVIESVIIIPGYAGEFLIQTKSSLIDSHAININSSDALTSFYTTDYYLNDCGGWHEWRKDKSRLLDPRLQAVSRVAMAIGASSKVVDLGAGRGELTRYFAEKGAEVTAIDYSANAVDLIQASFISDKQIEDRVKIICSSVLNPDVYSNQYDLAIASDIIEHLMPEENDQLYQLISSKLKPNCGSLVVHTAPNLWNYRYQHALQKKSAKQAGFWLPHPRRTWYERIMHINEQNPRVLKRQLLKYFPYVLLWFTDEFSMGGSLLRKFTVSDLRQAHSIFAIGSHTPIDQEKIANLFCMQALSQEDTDRIRLHIKQKTFSLKPDDHFSVLVIINNPTDKVLTSLMPHPFHLSYHWLNEIGAIVLYEGIRTPLPHPLNPGEQTEIHVNIKAPDKPGKYELCVLPVQEGVRWLNQSTCNMEVLITSNPSYNN